MSNHDDRDGPASHDETPAPHADDTSARSRLDTTEQRLLHQWRAWQQSPDTQPAWAEALRRRLSGPNRLHGMLLGAATGESFVHTGRVGERSTAMLFVLEGLLRARSEAASEPADYALAGLRRWMHTRGVPWRDCVPQGPPGTPDGWLVEQPELRERWTDDPAMLIGLARIAAGEPPGGNHSDSATALPLGALAALWHDDADTVFALGAELAGLTHGHPHGKRPAGVLGVTLFWLLQGKPLIDSVERAAEHWSPPELDNVLRLIRNRPAGFVPGRRQIEAMGAGRTGLDVLSIAIRAVAACPDDIAAALAVATDHDGDTASCAAVCGQLLGAHHGLPILPPRWLAELPLRRHTELLADEAVSVFGSYQDRADRVGDYQTGLTTAARVESSRDRFVGSVLACAIGEALGTPIASSSWDEIQARHGSDGLTAYIPAGHPAGRIGSDTQLLLFAVEGMIRANVARRTRGTHDPRPHLQHAYQRWLHTQHLSWSRAAGKFLEHTPEPDGWLVGQRALFQTRNPGRTMMRSLIAFAKGQRPPAPEKQSGGTDGSCAITRGVAAALWSDDTEEVFRAGMDAAAITHGDHDTRLGCGALAFLVARLLRGEDLPTAADHTLGHLSVHHGHEELSSRISTAIRLGHAGVLDPEALTRNLGSAATPAEALGIGVYATLASDGDFDRALAIAVNHAGNSAATGALSGCLVGALTGTDGIASRWLADLELRGVIEQLAQDATTEFGPRPSQQPRWFDRYPPT